MESVFIAWSGNEDLAHEVGHLLEAKGNRAIVGGGGPRGMYIGNQVIEEMNKCNHAIILAQKKEGGDGSSKFSDNLMFEWGYLISKLPAGRVKAYLINTSEWELPSDLGGSWADAIMTDDMTISEVAGRIVDNFKIERTKLDKLEVMASWQKVKSYLSEYARQHSRSHSEMAQYILYSVFSAYYNNEVDAFNRLLGDIRTTSPMLNAVIWQVQTMLRAYISTSYMARPLELREYYESVMILDNPFEDEVDDDEPDLKQWVQIIRLEHAQFCNYLMAESMSDDKDRHFHNEVIRLGKSAVELVEKNLQQYPENRYYAALLLSFLHRNMAVTYRAIGDESQAKEHLSQSVRQRQRFYSSYTAKHRDDVLVCDKVSQEYYLALLEQTEYERDPYSRRQIMNAVRGYLTIWEEESRRRQSLLHMVQDAYERVERTFEEPGQTGGESA